ncbi:putative haloacid dehalogenase-like hydrolase, partial [Planoprotostelium fungivorum]
TPGASCFVIGAPALVSALHEQGCRVVDADDHVDYVVVGETRTYDMHTIEQAIRCIRAGARLIGTNKDIFDRVGPNLIPSTGTLVAPIEIVTGRKAYFIGKPNPLIMSYAMNSIGTGRSETVIIGDRMDTDIIAGLELGIDSVLVLSGVTTKEDLITFGYKPTVVLGGRSREGQAKRSRFGCCVEGGSESWGKRGHLKAARSRSKSDQRIVLKGGATSAHHDIAKMNTLLKCSHSTKHSVEVGSITNAPCAFNPNRPTSDDPTLRIYETAHEGAWGAVGHRYARMQLHLILCCLFLMAVADDEVTPPNGLNPNYCGYVTSKMHVTGDWLQDSPYNSTNWVGNTTALLTAQPQYGLLCLWSLNVTGLPLNRTFQWKVVARGDWTIGNWGCAPDGQVTSDAQNCIFNTSSSGDVTFNFQTSGTNSSYYHAATGLIPLSDAISDRSSLRGPNLEPVTDGWNDHPNCGHVDARFKATGDWANYLYHTGDWNASSSFGNMTAMLDSGVECLMSITLQGLPAFTTYSWKVVAGANWDYGNWGCTTSGTTTFEGANCVFTTGSTGTVTLNVVTSGDDTSYRLYTENPNSSTTSATSSSVVALGTFGTSSPPDAFPAWAIAVIVVVAVIVLSSIITVFLVVRKRRSSQKDLEDGYSHIVTNALRIDYEELKDSKVVGEGAFGVVSMAVWRKSQVAVKQMTSSNTITNKALQEFFSEVQIMQNLRPHPNVVLFMGVCVPPQPFCIVTEYCERGSLLTYLRSTDAIPEEEQFRLINGIALGMLHLHSEKVQYYTFYTTAPLTFFKIVHRDLAARNVLLSKHLEHKIGPVKWMSPVRSHTSQEYSIKSDVFSFGIVMWEIVHPKEEPWGDETLLNVAMEVVKGKRLMICDNCPPKLANLMRGDVILTLNNTHRCRLLGDINGNETGFLADLRSNGTPNAQYEPIARMPKKMLVSPSATNEITRVVF